MGGCSARTALDRLLVIRGKRMTEVLSGTPMVEVLPGTPIAEVLHGVA